LISNLNKNDTHPSLKIIYRQNVCNVQGIGVINMLNVLEKIIPDDTLSSPFSDEKEKKLQEAKIKFDRLSDLFSRKSALIDWHINNKKTINAEFTNIVFTVNQKNCFIWQFKNQSFGFDRIPQKNNDWRKDISWEKAPTLLKAWVRAEIQNLRHNVEHPSELYAFNLLSPETAGIAIDKIFEHNWLHLKSLIPQLIGKTLYVDDLQAQQTIYTLLHTNKGCINSEYHAELDWKSYIPNYEAKNTTNDLLEFAKKSEYWNVLQNYSIEDNINIKSHVHATKIVYLPLVKWICDSKPEAINSTAWCSSYDLIKIAIELGHTHILDYLAPSPDYKYSNLSLLHLAINSTYDMTDYISDLIKKGINPNIVNNGGETALHCVSTHSHINNVKLLINKIVENNLSLDSVDKYKMTPLISFISNASFEAFFYLLNKGASLEIANECNPELLHFAIENKQYDIVKFLIEKKDYNINQKNESGDTPLHLLLEQKNINQLIEIVRFFISNGAKTNIQNNTGNTPLHSLLKRNPGNAGISIDNFIEIINFIIQTQNHGACPVDEEDPLFFKRI
jgi:hypothetical protein